MDHNAPQASSEAQDQKGLASPKSARAPSTLGARLKLPTRLRTAIRALHRDAGYLAVGLTFVYALSGLAVNHIEDWDPNFTQVRNEYTMQLPANAADDATAQSVLRALEIDETPLGVYRSTPDRLEITLAESTLYVSSRGHVVQEGQSPRFLLRAANWLHLNRGKKAWTYVADTYAVVLLLLATSGLFMIPGRKGVLGRGALFVLTGAAVPVLYVWLSGGP